MSASAFGIAEEALEYPSDEHIAETHRIAVEADAAWALIRQQRLEVAERIADAAVFHGTVDSDAAEQYKQLHQAQVAARTRRTLATEELNRTLAAHRAMADRA